jgi:hypothetical protein
VTPEPFDRDLRKLFQELRSQDLRQAPEFRESMADALGREVHRPRPTPEKESRHPGLRWASSASLRLLWKGGLLAAAAAAILLLARSPGTSDAEFERVVRAYVADPAAGAWRSPTDDLLKLPGLDLLSSVPSLGDKGWPGSREPRPRRNQL